MLDCVVPLPVGTPPLGPETTRDHPVAGFGWFKPEAVVSAGLVPAYSPRGSTVRALVLPSCVAGGASDRDISGLVRVLGPFNVEMVESPLEAVATLRAAAREVGCAGVKVSDGYAVPYAVEGTQAVPHVVFCSVAKCHVREGATGVNMLLQELGVDPADRVVKLALFGPAHREADWTTTGKCDAYLALPLQSSDVHRTLQRLALLPRPSDVAPPSTPRSSTFITEGGGSLPLKRPSTAPLRGRRKFSARPSPTPTGSKNNEPMRGRLRIRKKTPPGTAAMQNNNHPNALVLTHSTRRPYKQRPLSSSGRRSRRDDSSSIQHVSLEGNYSLR